MTGSKIMATKPKEIPRHTEKSVLCLFRALQQGWQERCVVISLGNTLLQRVKKKCMFYVKEKARKIPFPAIPITP